MAYVYMQEHDDGRYYIGKYQGPVHHRYKGGGVELLKSLKVEPDKWTKYIVSSDLDNNQAKWLERAMVGQDAVDDDICLNKKRGGDGGNLKGAGLGRKLSVAHRKAIGDGRRGITLTDEHKAVLALRSTGQKHSTITKNKISETLKKYFNKK